MYILKYNKEETKKIFKKFNKTQKKIAVEIGVTRTYISQIVNGRKTSKLCAYAISKALNSDLEILDLFIQK